MWYTKAALISSMVAVTKRHRVDVDGLEHRRY